MIVRLDGVPDELGRTIVVFDPDFIIVERDNMPLFLSKSRASAFGVLPAVCEDTLRDVEAYEVLKPFIDSADHIIALVEGGGHVKGRRYYVKPDTDILPIHVKFFLDAQATEDLGPLLMAFKRASDTYRAVNQKLSQIGSERALILDRLHVDGEAASRLAELAEEEESLRRELKKAYVERKTAGEALRGRLRSLGLDKAFQRFPKGVVTAHIPLLRHDVVAAVSESAAGPASYIYRNVLKIIGYRELSRLYRSMAISSLVKAINTARCAGSAEALVWVRGFLRVSARGRFVATFSLNGSGHGVKVLDTESMPDFETLSATIPANIRDAFRNGIEVRGEDVMNLIDRIKPIGESNILLPIGIKALLSFQPKLQEQQLGEQV